jgi:tetrahydromethanopterin S-methyltransferase subunit D
MTADTDLSDNPMAATPHPVKSTRALVIACVMTTMVMIALIAASGSLIMGFGLGLISVSSLVLIQEMVEWTQRGSVTASNVFSRNLGSTLGATLLGAVLNHGLTRSLGAASVTSDQLRHLLDPSPGIAIGDAAIRFALQQALNLTFWAMLAMAFATVLIALAVPAPPSAPVQVQPAAQVQPD